jgi:hypothetical protein
MESIRQNLMNLQKAMPIKIRRLRVQKRQYGTIKILPSIFVAIKGISSNIHQNQSNLELLSVPLPTLIFVRFLHFFSALHPFFTPPLENFNLLTEFWMRIRRAGATSHIPKGTGSSCRIFPFHKRAYVNLLNC